MFQLSDKTRRPVCVAIFFSACVLPTLCVFAWGVSRNAPWHASHEARRLGNQLGLHVAIEAVEHPRPGVVVYRNLELSNPETNAAILHCDQLTAQWETIEPYTPCLVLIVAGAKINAAEKELLWPMVQGMLAREVGSPGYVRLAADSVEVRHSARAREATNEGASQQSPPNSHTLTDVGGKIDTFDQWMQADLTFYTASADKPTRIHVKRNRQGGHPFTSYTLDTGGQSNDSPDPTAPALPCDLLGLVFEPFAGLGPESRFRGHVFADVMHDGHNGQFRGQFLDIDLHRIQDQIHGKADLYVESAIFAQGRLLNAVAQFDARDGAISGPMLRQAVERLGLQWSDHSYDPRDERPAPFKQIGASFVLDANGLRILRGTCDSDMPNTIMTGINGPLVDDPVPADSIPLLPAPQETAWLMDYMPSPR